MAKNKEPQPSQQGKMTIMLIQLEGDNSTLQQGIRTFQEAMGRAMPPAIITRPQVHSNGSGTLPAPATESPADPQNEFVFDDSIIVDESAPVANATSKPAKDRKPPQMEIVKTLDFHPEDGKSLKEFYAEKAPDKQLELITVFVYYLC
jgi:hypothetical protein